jgi:hypothetical protein
MHQKSIKSRWEETTSSQGLPPDSVSSKQNKLGDGSFRTARLVGREQPWVGAPHAPG